MDVIMPLKIANGKESCCSFSFTGLYPCNIYWLNKVEFLESRGVVICKLSYKNNRICVCMSVCIYLRILQSSEPIWFSLKVKLLIGSGNV